MVLITTTGKLTGIQLTPDEVALFMRFLRGCPCRHCGHVHETILKELEHSNLNFNIVSPESFNEPQDQRTSEEKEGLQGVISMLENNQTNLAIRQIKKILRCTEAK